VPEFVNPTDAAAAPFLVSRRTRNGVGGLDRARLAAWYVAQVAGGDRNPARTLAERYPDSSYKTWTNVFSRMRTQQPALLTEPPRRGAAGGDLTDHADRLLGRSFTIPEGLKEHYEAGRDVYPAPVRRAKRTSAPRRSRFSSDADFEHAYDAWANHGQWIAEHEVGPRTYEEFEDWWVRMIEGDDDADDW
jgi:hypothetical protein